MRQVQMVAGAVPTVEVGGHDFEPTVFPVVPIEPESPPTEERVSGTVVGTVWVTITDDGAQVLCRDYLPHRAVQGLMKARKLIESDQSLLFEAVDGILDRVLVDREAFEEWVEAPENRVDSARYFDVFNRIVAHFLPTGSGKA